MNLNDLANLGQIVGAIGVMITLVWQQEFYQQKVTKRTKRISLIRNPTLFVSFVSFCKKFRGSAVRG